MSTAVSGNEGSRTSPAVTFILIAVTLNMMATGVIMPVLPGLLTELTGGDVSRAAQLLGVFGAAGALMQLLFSPLLGALSDRVGRRPVILVSSVCLGLDYIVMALAPTVAWLFVGRLISGVAAASSGTAGAYIGDVTEPGQRAAAFGKLGAAVGLGFILGPALGGLVGSLDPRAPFWLAAALSLLSTLYGALVLPESLRPEHRSAFTWRTASPMASFEFFRSRPGLSRLALVSFLSALATQCLPSVFVIYASYRYKLEEGTVGLMLAGVGIANALVSGTLVKPTISRFGHRRILLGGLSFGVIGLFLHGSGSSIAVFSLGIPAIALMSLSGAALAGLMSRFVGSQEQGRLQGASGSIVGITSLIGPILFTEIFSLSSGTLGGEQQAGAPFLVGALMLAVAAAIAMTVTVPAENADSTFRLRPDPTD